MALHQSDHCHCCSCRESCVSAGDQLQRGRLLQSVHHCCRECVNFAWRGPLSPLGVGCHHKASTVAAGSLHGCKLSAVTTGSAQFLSQCAAAASGPLSPQEYLVAALLAGCHCSESVVVRGLVLIRPKGGHVGVIARIQCPAPGHGSCRTRSGFPWHGRVADHMMTACGRGLLVQW
jgi:hypothetical protein